MTRPTHRTYEPSPTRTLSHIPGGSDAERLFDELKNTELTERLRFPRTPLGRALEKIRRAG